MTVPQQSAQIALFTRRHPDRGKAILREQCQQQERVPPIVLLLACLGLADFLGMTHAAFDPQLFHQLQKPVHRSGGFDPHQNLAAECGIKLPHLFAIVLEGLLNQFPCVGIQHRNRLLSSV